MGVMTSDSILYNSVVIDTTGGVKKYVSMNINTITVSTYSTRTFILIFNFYVG